MSSLRRSDLLALSYLRNDGRKPREIRRMRVRMGPMGAQSGGVSGSAQVDMGLTSVLVAVRGPSDCARRAEENQERAILEVSVRAPPFAPSGDRKTVNPSSDRRLVELSSQIRSAMEASVLLHLHPRSRIDLDVYVLADDGGRLSAAVNAATLALLDAGVPLLDLVCSSSAGVSAGAGPDGSDVTLVDLNRIELSSVGGGAAVGGGGTISAYIRAAFMPQRGTVVLAQCESRLPPDSFNKLLETALEGCRAVYDVLQAAVRDHTAQLLAARAGNADVALLP